MRGHWEEELQALAAEIRTASDMDLDWKEEDLLTGRRRTWSRWCAALVRKFA